MSNGGRASIFSLRAGPRENTGARASRVTGRMCLVP